MPFCTCGEILRSSMKECSSCSRKNPYFEGESRYAGDGDKTYLSKAFGRSTAQQGLAAVYGEQTSSSSYSVKCDECGKSLTDVYQVGKSKYCNSCYDAKYTCAGCGRSITGQYIQKEGQLWHSACFNQESKCQGCRKPIIGQGYEACGGLYHTECFNCAVCDSNLLGGKYIERNNLAYCESCNEEVGFSKVSSGTVSTTKVVRSQEEADEANAKMASNIAKGKGKCAVCFKAFGVKDDSINVQGDVYHAWCFTCGWCNKELDSQFQRKDKTPYHPECYKKKFAIKCTSCGTPITGQYAQVSGEKYHPQCFKCTGCSGSLSGGYAMKYGSPYCSKCAGSGSSSVSKTTVETGRKKGFTVNPMTGEKVFRK